MFNIVNIRKNDKLILYTGKTIIVDDEILKVSELSNFLKKTKKIIRNNKVIYKDMYSKKEKVYFDVNTIQHNDVFVLWNNEMVKYSKFNFNENELNSILADTKKILRNNIWIARKRNYKLSFEFNKRYNFCRRMNNRKTDKKND